MRNKNTEAFFILFCFLILNLIKVCQQRGVCSGWVWVPVCILRELLLDLIPTNTTKILQARKQIEYDNNEH